MAVGRISGQLLKANLLRDGVDLAFETDLLYLDVNNNRVGINNATPQYDLDVTGTTRTTLFEVTNFADISDINITGNTISTNGDRIVLGTADNVIYQNKAIIDDIELENNVIRTNTTNANIDFRPNGTGTVNVHSNMNVEGNIYATGDIIADGTITIGDQDTDFVTFNSRVNSDIIPTTNNTFSLGSDPALGGNQWADVHVQTFFAGTIDTTSINIDGIDVTRRQGNIIYVSQNGSDTLTGTHPQDPFGSIRKALSVATNGDTVYITPGTYTEQFPLTVPVGVTVKGEGLRSVTVQPTQETRYNNCFLLNGETTVEELTVKGFQSGGNYHSVVSVPANNQLVFNVGTAPFAHTYVSGGTFDVGESTQANITNSTYNHANGELTITIDGLHDSHVGNKHFLSGLVFSCNGGTKVFPDDGYAFRFATDYEVTTRSPYIRNASVITSGTITSASDPRGFNAGDAGKGAYFDGAYATTNSREAGILFHSATFICPGVDAVSFTNGVRVEWLNCFTYFADKGVNAFDSNDGLKGAGRTALRVSDVTGTFLAGQTVTYYDTDGVTVLATGTIDEKDTDGKFYLTGKVSGFDYPQTRVGKQVGVNGNAGLDSTIKKYGTASLALHEAGDFLNILPQNDFGFGSDDFTFETWAYFDDLTGVHYLYDFRAGSDADLAPALYTNGNDLVYFTDNTAQITAVGAIPNTGQWYHIAVSRQGTNTKLWVDGAQAGTTYSDNNFYGATKPLAIGSKFGGVSALNGNLDDVRVINGTAVYTANFTPPTRNLYSIPNTVLLLKMDGSDSSVDINDEEIFQQDIRFSGGATATKVELADYTDFGAEVRMIGSASVYGNYGLYGDGEGVIIYAIGQNLAYIGNGKEVTNDPGTVIQENEVVQLNGAKVRFNSVDHKGDFRVGDLFYVNQEDGTVEFTSSDFRVQSQNGFTFTDGFNTTVINSVGIDTGNLRIRGNTIETLSEDLNFDAASDQINLNNNVLVDGNLDVTGNLTLGGNITIGDEASDSIEFVAGIDSDILPSVTSEYNLGSNALQWKNIYANQADIDDVRIKNNYITTTTSNSNLELRANGTGFIEIDNLSFDNITISSTGNINLESDNSFVKVNTTGAIKLPTGTTAERPAVESGLIRFNTELSRFEGYNGTAWIQLNGVVDVDGDTKITAELNQGANDNIIRFDVAGTTVIDIDSTRLNAPRIVVDDISIDTNVITTITPDTNLLLAGNGTGAVLLENFAFDQNTITNTVADSITEFVNTGDGYVKVTGTNGFVIPVGDNTNRPNPAFTETGMMRFNTADGRVEAFDGNQWGSVAGATGAITTIDAGFLAVETALFLG